MTIAVVGLNYRTAPIEIREKLTLSGGALRVALEDLRTLAMTQEAARPSASVINEAVVLSTCNRCELYVSAQHVDDELALIEQFLSQLQCGSVTDLRANLYQHRGEDAIQHLMRVACGLDSMILGEAQILGQVTQALADAQQAGAGRSVLTHLFTQAIHAGKRARTETHISRHTMSISQAAVALLLERLDRRVPRVLVIGAGRMAVLAAQALKRSRVSELTFINRTASRAKALADDFGGKAVTWQQMAEALIWADAVISATGAPHTVIRRRDIEAVLDERLGRPLVLVDIAVPRDIEDTVQALPAVRYFNIDDLHSAVDAGLELRQAAIPAVETIIQQEMLVFAEWYHGRQVAPVIKDLRAWAQTVALVELEQTLNRLPDADERTRKLVNRLVHRLVSRFLHEPTTRLRQQATEGNGYRYAQAVRELFSLRDPAGLDSLSDVAPSSADSDHAKRNLQRIVPPAAGPQA